MERADGAEYQSVDIVGLKWECAKLSRYRYKCNSVEHARTRGKESAETM